MTKIVGAAPQETRRKQIEEALHESEEKYRLIAENMTDLVCVIDIEGYFKYASPSHVTVLGHPSEAYEGHLAQHFMHQDDFPSVHLKLGKSRINKESCVFEFRFRDIKDNWIWLEGKSTAVFNSKGDFQHFLVVSREITERKMYEEKLAHMAFHDMLTDLPNRRLFKDRLDHSLKEAKRYERKMAVVYMDIDNFKEINDTHGHDVGDELLKLFAKKVKESLRESDTVSRLGGDEFTILLPEIQREKDAVDFATRIIGSLQEPWVIGSQSFKTTSSLGIAFYPKDGVTSHELMKNSDIALYQAKNEGKNTFKTYSLLEESKNMI
ncbi:MAG TPA: sensor domain-containing diguanylate cyclase [Sporolactobacillaceae bacterium]|nr:sensor domain-containing diguanylate cyclase [Sporolactobacillaceae bacterium]